MRYVVGKDANGEYGDTINVADYIRGMRNEALAECDWTQAADSPLSDEKKAEWATYRQQLRDITNSLTESSTIDDIVFPTKPE
tara:strand:- start:943 stop:1191 length:249 start_codon:yes stop_codon:yes gene_type:complete